jgi:hypothetical protein
MASLPCWRPWSPTSSKPLVVRIHALPCPVCPVPPTQALLLDHVQSMHDWDASVAAGCYSLQSSPASFLVPSASRGLRGVCMLCAHVYISTWLHSEPS